jgi:AcrR family transcriptional regulator
MDSFGRGGASAADRTGLLGMPDSPSPLRRGRRGFNGPSEQEIAEHQRARLRAAMLEAVGEHGYEALSVSELCRRAGVSKTTLYDHYKGGMHDCFLSLYGQVLDALFARLVEVWLAGDEPDQRLCNVVAELVLTTAGEPAAARLAFREPFAVGPCAVEEVENAHRRARDLLTAALEGQGAHPSCTAVGAIVAGVSSVVRARVLAGAPADLMREGAELSRWACLCLKAPAEGARVAGLPFAFRPSERLLDRAGQSWEPARARVAAATLSLVAERGYAGVSEQAIRSAAQVTRTEFREHFGGVHAALGHAVETLWTEALQHAARVGSTARQWPQGVARATLALLSCLLADETFARVAFIEMSCAGGSGGLAERIGLLGSVASTLQASAPKRMRPSRTTAEASIAACWAIVRDRVRHGEQHELVKDAPTLAFIVLAPAIGARQAALAIEDALSGGRERSRRSARALA